MHRFYRILTALIVLLAGIVIAPSAALPSQPLNWQLYAGVYQPGPKPVAIRDFAFAPNVILIPVGTTIRWTNGGAAKHTVTSDTSLFGSGELDPGASFEYRFDVPGTYGYHCALHPMTGTVIVVDQVFDIYLPLIFKAAP
jgi:plastocyanin